MKKYLLMSFVLLTSCATQTTKVEWVNNNITNQDEIKSITLNCKQEMYKVPRPVYEDCPQGSGYAVGYCRGQNSKARNEYHAERDDVFQMCMELKGFEKVETIIQN